MNSSEVVPGSAELVRTAPLLPMDAEQATAAMEAYQDLTRRLLTPADWIGRPGEPESFVRRSGWSKVATFYGVSTEILERSIERDDEGRPVRAYVLVRAVAQNGRHADGDGACGANEPRFRSSSGRQKIEHDLGATAATRATNRAISNLVGFGEVSAEEVDADVRAGAEPDASPDWAHGIDEDAGGRFVDNLETILFATADVHEPGVAAFEVGRSLAAFCDGVIPVAAARLAKLLADAVKPTAPGVPELDDEPAAAAPDVPPQEG